MYYSCNHENLLYVHFRSLQAHTQFKLIIEIYVSLKNNFWFIRKYKFIGDGGISKANFHCTTHGCSRTEIYTYMWLKNVTGENFGVLNWLKCSYWSPEEIYSYIGSTVQISPLLLFTWKPRQVIKSSFLFLYTQRI